MADIRTAMKLIGGVEPTPASVQHVQSIAHSLDIPTNDPMLPILIALDTYHGVFKELPERNRQAANEAADMSAKMVKAHVDRVLAEAVRDITPTMSKAMDKVAESAAQNAGGKSMAQWALGCVAGTVLCFGLFGWWMHSTGYDSGRADAIQAAAWMTTPAGQAAYKAYQADPVMAEWAGSREARTAYKLSKSDDLVAIANCDRKGWKKEAQMNGTTVCVPRPDGKNIWGWVVP